MIVFHLDDSAKCENHSKSQASKHICVLSFIALISSDWVRVLIVLLTESNLLIQNCQRMSTSAQIEKLYLFICFLFMRLDSLEQSFLFKAEGTSLS